jgi:hypothetical protein
MCRAGGVWQSWSKNIHPALWHLPWPANITAPLISSTNPKGGLTINDLEMAGLLLEYLVLELLMDLEHKHVAAWCDNISTVGWAHCMTSIPLTLGTTSLFT